MVLALVLWVLGGRPAWIGSDFPANPTGGDELDLWFTICAGLTIFTLSPYLVGASTGSVLRFVSHRWRRNVTE